MISCKLCGSTHCRQLPSVEKCRTLIICCNCTLVFVPPDEWLTIDDEKSRYDLHTNNDDDAGYLKFLSQVVPYVEKRVTNDSRVLDFGSGKNALLTKILREQNILCYAYDPLYNLGLDLLNSPYSMVIMSEVIEHLRLLKDELQRLDLLLCPQSFLLIRTRLYPSIEKIHKWWYIQDASHINFFSVKSLMCLADLMSARLITTQLDDLFIIEKAK